MFDADGQTDITKLAFRNFAYAPVDKAYRDKWREDFVNVETDLSGL